MAIDLSILAKLEPISTLSPSRLNELASLCFVEKVSKDIDPFRMNVVKSAQAMYLLSGELGLTLANGNSKILRAGSEEARHPIDIARLQLQSTIALSEIEIVRIDLDLLDIMMTWDQLATIEGSEQHQGLTNSRLEQKRDVNDWMTDTKAFGVEKLLNGVFSRLPSANIEEMFHRMIAVEVKAGQVIIRQGNEGDYYYLIENGCALVTRDAGQGESATLAQLVEGDTFGEDALVSDSKRNATVTMKTDGLLLRLDKSDFIELLKAPLINHITLDMATKAVNNGAVWLDVRLPSEFKFDHMPNAVNFPMNQLRSLVGELDISKQYIAYCQTGRRSSAAAFILVQHGFSVFVLIGGMRGKN